LLSQAVGWWDAAAYRDGDRLLRNRGVAGELLDLQLGSSDRVATTNDPLFLAPEDTGYVYLPGVSGNRLSVPDENALDITGDLDLRAQVSMDAFSGVQVILSKRTAATTQSSYQMDFSGATVRIIWSEDGTTNTNVTSTANVPYSPGTAFWVRATLDVDNGASGYDVKFFTSDNGSSWTQLGTTVTGVATTSVYAGTSNLIVGSIAASNPLAGRIYRAQVLDGIDGTKVLDVDCDAITDGSATSFQAVTGQTVTINRSSGGRKTVAVPRRNGGGRSLFLLGTDDYFQCVDNWQRQLLNFEQQDSFTVVAVVRRWATQSSSSVIITKDTDLSQASSSGYGIRGTATGYIFMVADGTTQSGSTSVNESLGGTTVVMGSQNAIIPTRISYVNGSAGTIGAANLLSSANTLSVRVGRGAGSGTSYADMEFTSAAIFRKALTPDEIKTITDYYQNRGF
jgi:hypothetical protein